jgi:hypothetical protein
MRSPILDVSFLSGLSRLAKRYLVDQVNAIGSDEHCQRCVARVAQPCVSAFHLTASCMFCCALGVPYHCSMFSLISL